MFVCLSVVDVCGSSVRTFTAAVSRSAQASPTQQYVEHKYKTRNSQLRDGQVLLTRKALFVYSRDIVFGSLYGIQFD